MKYALLGDIHGNIYAFEKCIDSIRKKEIKNIILLGDYIAEIPRSNEVIELIMELEKEFNCYIIKGNRDQGIIDYKNTGRFDGYMAPALMKYTYDNLKEENLDFILNLPESLEIVNGHDSLFIIHNIEDAPEDKKIVIVGHDHLVFDIQTENRRVICPGSAGQSLNNKPFAYYSILEINGNDLNVNSYFEEYDVEKAVESLFEIEEIFERKGFFEFLIKQTREGSNFVGDYFERVYRFSNVIYSNKGEEISDEVWEKCYNSMKISK